jgi:hypothetical protein
VGFFLSSYFLWFFLFGDNYEEVSMPLLISGEPAQDFEFNHNPVCPQAQSRVAARVVPDQKTVQTVPPEDGEFLKKFDSLRYLFEDIYAREADLKDLDLEKVLEAWVLTLKEISPKYGCPRWQTFRKAAGWTISFRSFIEDRKKLSDYLYRAEWAPFLAEVREYNAKIQADYAQEKKEKAREKELARRGFHS